MRAGGSTAAQVAALSTPGYGAANFSVMWSGRTVATLAMAAVDVVYLYPFFVAAPRVTTSLFQRCETLGAGSALKTAIWRNNPATARPTGLPVLGQNAGFDTTTAGIKSVAIASVPLSIGWYWGGTKGTGTLPIMTSIDSADCAAPIAAPAATLQAAFEPVGFSAPDAYPNDIIALDLTSATFTLVNNSRVPILGLGWA